MIILYMRSNQKSSCSQNHGKVLRSDLMQIQRYREI